MVVGFYERAPGGGSLMGQGSAALMSEQVRAGELRFAAGRGYGGSTQHAGHTSIGGIVILEGKTWSTRSRSFRGAMIVELGSGRG